MKGLYIYICTKDLRAKYLHLQSRKVQNGTYKLSLYKLSLYKTSAYKTCPLLNVYFLYEMFPLHNVSYNII